MYFNNSLGTYVHLCVPLQFRILYKMSTNLKKLCLSCTDFGSQQWRAVPVRPCKYRGCFPVRVAYNVLRYLAASEKPFSALFQLYPSFEAPRRSTLPPATCSWSDARVLRMCGHAFFLQSGCDLHFIISSQWTSGILYISAICTLVQFQITTVNQDWLLIR